MDKENDRYTFMKPGIACSETGFKGRSDLILYYDMLNRMKNYFELNTIIKKFHIKCIIIQRGFDDKWNIEKKSKFFNEVDLHNITEFFASEVNYEQIIDLCPNITTIELDLRGGKICRCFKS